MYSWTSEFQGQPLVEVFGVRFPHHDDDDGEAPAGTVSVFDGKRGQILYSSDNPSPRRQSSGAGGILPLTGPYRAVSADGCVAFVLDLHRRRPHDNASSTSSSSSSEILVDVYDEATTYDELTTRGDGRGAEVTYALLSDAAEAVVQVTLLRQRASGTVSGTVVAGTAVGEVVLFEDRGASVGTEDAVPLARSAVAVPLTSSLTVEVDLVVGDGEEAVRETVACVPALGSDDVQRRPAAGVAAVQVKVTWLD